MTFNGYELTNDEFEILYDTFINIRKEKEKENRRKKNKHEISFAIANSISEIGLAETKNLVRELNRELRDMK